MEELFGDPAYKGFVLQDKKRLPARFFARISRRADQPTSLEPTGSRPPAGLIPTSLSASTDLRT